MNMHVLMYIMCVCVCVMVHNMWYIIVTIIPLFLDVYKSIQTMKLYDIIMILVKTIIVIH